MRRKDREITDINEIHKVMDGCSYCRLGFYDEGEVYIIPLNFGYIREEEVTTLYFHGAKEGRKISLIEKTDKVGFEMDCDYMLKEGDLACSHTARFQSIIGNGKISMVEDKEEKVKGLEAIMYQSTKKRNWEFPEARINGTGVFKVVITNMACKIHE